MRYEPLQCSQYVEKPVFSSHYARNLILMIDASLPCSCTRVFFPPERNIGN